MPRESTTRKQVNVYVDNAIADGFRALAKAAGFERSPSHMFERMVKATLGDLKWVHHALAKALEANPRLLEDERQRQAAMDLVILLGSLFGDSAP